MACGVVCACNHTTVRIPEEVHIPEVANHNLVDENYLVVGAYIPVEESYIPVEGRTRLFGKGV